MGATGTNVHVPRNQFSAYYGELASFAILVSCGCGDRQFNSFNIHKCLISWFISYVLLT